MSIETKAAIQTLKYIGSIVIIATVLVILSELFGTAIMAYSISFALFTLGCYLVYSFNLSNLKYEQEKQERELKRAK
jgi:ABC-type transport system involved in Fe-S cluster assembly fused permease/ATPase subunit